MKKWLIRGSIVVLVLLVVVVVAVGLFLDGAIKKGVETYGPQLTKVSTKVDGVKIFILSGSGGVKGLVVGNPEGFKTAHAISIGHASLGLSPGSLLSDKVVIKHLRVESPEIIFEGGIRGNNLSKILDNVNAAAGSASTKPEEPRAAQAGKKLQVDDLLIKDAKVLINLTDMGGQTIPITIPDIHLTNLGTGEQGITAAELTKVVLNEIVAAATKAASSDAVKNLSKSATEAVKEVGGKATDALKGAADIFNKKK